MVRIALGIAAVAVLGACASLPEAGRPLPGGFELSGRVAVRYGKDAASGRVFWRHSSDADELLITSPLGQGIARLNRNGDQFRLVTGDRKEYRADNAEDLTEQALAGADLSAIADASGHAADGTSPSSDLNGAADYRQHLARVLTRRAVAAAAGA